MCVDHQSIYCAFSVINADWILNNYNYLYITFRLRCWTDIRVTHQWIIPFALTPLWFVMVCSGLLPDCGGAVSGCAVWELQCARFTPTTCYPIPAVSPGASGARSPPCGRYVCLFPCVSRGKTERRWTVSVTTVNDDGIGRPRAGPRAAGHSRTNSHFYIIFMTLTRALYDAFIKL